MIDLVAEGCAGAARWFDVIETETSHTRVSFKNNTLYSITSREQSGVGIRVNVEGRTGFSYTNDKARAIDAARRAVECAAFGEEEDLELPSSAEGIFNPYDTGIEGFSLSSEIAGIEEAVASIKNRFPSATVDADSSCTTGRTRILNSRGLDASYQSSIYRISISATIVMEDGSRVNVWDGFSTPAPASIQHLPEAVITQLGNALTVRKIPSGAVPVLFTPKAVARLIGILTAPLSASSVWRGISPFTGRIEERIFNPAFTLRDDPVLADSPFSYPFDDEGVTAKTKDLVACGTLQRFITDLRHAARLGISAEGNGGRNYYSLPSPSFSNVVIVEGREPCSSLMAGISRGILVDQFIGLGQSNTLQGDFSANLDLAYLIENGTVIGRVKDCMIAGNLFSLLAGEVVFSAERERRGSVTAPYILFPSVDLIG